MENVGEPHSIVECHTPRPHYVTFEVDHALAVRQNRRHPDAVAILYFEGGDRGACGLSISGRANVKPYRLALLMCIDPFHCDVSQRRRYCDAACFVKHRSQAFLTAKIV